MALQSKCESSISVLKACLVLGSLFFSAVLFPSRYQPALDSLWDVLGNNSFYRWSTFETIWTVFCYAIIEPYIAFVFVNHPEWRLLHESKATTTSRDRPRGMRRTSRRKLEMLTYITPLLLSGNYDPSNSTSPSKHHRTFLILTLRNTTLSSPLQTRRALRPHAPSSRRLALELVTSLALYDTLFFLFHLALHTIPPLRSLHAPHDAQLNAQVTNQLHVFERLGLELLANFSLNVIGSHVLTRTVFVPVFVCLLVEIPSGLELPWGYEKVLPKGWGGGARKHLRHHRGGEGGV